MRRLSKPFGLALGLSILAANCSPDRPVAPALKHIGATANAGSTTIVISQVYGGGAAGTSTYRAKFVELFNKGTTPVSLSGWSLQYASATGTGNFAGNGPVALSGTIQPGRYFLIQVATPGTAGLALPTPDLTSSTSLNPAQGSGKLIVANTTTGLACNGSSGQPCNATQLAQIVDLVGYGTANFFEGAAAVPATSTTTAAVRKDGGCLDSDNNSSDFTVATPNPRNSASPANPCDAPPPPPVVASVTVTPASATVVTGASAGFTAAAFDASSNPIGGVTFTWSTGSSAIATVNTSGAATGVTVGTTSVRATAPNGVFGEASLQVDVRPPDPPPAPVNVVEIHYDNAGTDVGEAIEIEGPAGYSLDGWSLVLYNQTGAAVYDTRALTGTFADQCSGRGTLVFNYPQDGIQNGPSDGIALVRGTTVVEFLSYEGTLTASNGPAGGMTSTDVGVVEGTSASASRSIQKDALGWYGPNPSSFGQCNKALDPFVSVNTGRANLPVGFEDQIFATLNDGRGGQTPSTFTWTSETPALASIDADGVVHAHAAGTAILRATAPSGATGTASLPLIIATPGPASYASHVEFGTPTDGNADDDFIISRPFYTTSFNTAKGIPNWVSFNLEVSHIGGGERCDCFTYDPELPPAGRYTTADYTGVGGATPYHGYPIDRGHLLRSFDRESGLLDNANTFYFSNIIPQAADNNQGPWSALEIYLGDLARFSNKEIFIIAGASGSKGTVKDEGKITIPAATWKVAVILPKDHGLANVDSYDDVEVIAIIMPNGPMSRSTPWQNFATTVDAVEALSGYDLLSLMPRKVGAILETGMQDEMRLIDQFVSAGRINRGNGNSLQAKLEAAAAAIERGETVTARHQLEALLREIAALDNKRLPAAEANALSAAVLALIASLAT